jgi:hypothetical protein
MNRPDVLGRTLDRRRFLRNAALAAGAAMIPGSLLRQARAAGPLPPYVGELDTQRLVSAGELWDWQSYMVGLGPRFTGSPQHVAYLDFLEQECRSAGLTTFHDPTQYFPRWDADYTACSLAILEAGGSSTDLEVMSYFPGSGNTSNMPGGALVAPVVDVGQGLPEDFAPGLATGGLKDAIAFCTEPPPPTTEVLAYPYYYNDDPDLTMNPATPWNKWSLGILTPQSLATPALAQQAGCAGMIIALQATRKCAYGQYISFLFSKVQGDQAHGAPGMPILYVDYHTGQYLRSRLSALGSSTTARMVLPSKTYPNTGTDEIVAFLPGADGDPNDPSKGENVVVASHTDGTSASEENGPLGMLAIAKYFAQIPRSQRRRSMVFCFATGHFTGYTKDTAWFTAAHPEILANTAATLTVEHLGQKSFTDDPVANTYTDDGYPEIGISYVSQDPILIQSVIANYQTENLIRSPVLNGPGFGVSQAFFDAALPSYGFITGPNTLYQMDARTGLEGTDPARLHQEVRTFVRILQSWESLSREELSSGKSAAR